jgi:outer membrane protein assembly factor BamE (lipoprotein component of BamABCDE complex)
VDTRESVVKVLGKPTFIAQFGGGEWYYLSRDTRYLGYTNPKPTGQMTLRIRFDAKGVVSKVDKLGMEQVASIVPSKKVTPTLGRHRSFFQDLFGNIGTVGAGGVGQGNDGGGRETP